MMKVIVVGGNGFIGGHFVEQYGDRFEKVVVVTRATQSPSSNSNKVYCTMADLLSGAAGNEQFDAIVNAAFDHQYQHNIEMLDSIWALVGKLRIPRVIYLSSMAVYNPFDSGILNTSSPYASLYDPYVLEKQKTERYLRKLAHGSSVTVSILQPTIVYGFGGNWTANGIDGALCQWLDLPSHGEGQCNAVHVSDVAQAIWSRVNAQVDNKVSTFLINGSESLSWRQFYKGHAQALGVTLNIEQFADNGKQFHAKLPINLLLWFWFRTPLGYVLNFLLGMAKRIKKSGGHSSNAREMLKSRIARGVQSLYRPIGMSRVAHAAQCTVTEEHAATLYANPRKSFADGMRELENELTSLK